MYRRHSNEKTLHGIPHEQFAGFVQPFALGYEAAVCCLSAVISFMDSVRGAGVSLHEPHVFIIG